MSYIRPLSVLTFCLALSPSTNLLASDNHLKAETCKSTSPVNTYDVYRKNKKIGSHMICFKQNGAELSVFAETQMKVKFLFITAYKYTYQSHETWVDGKLKSVNTRVNDNGKKSATSAVDESTNGETLENAINIPYAFYTTNHWNSSAVMQPSLFNTITGELNKISVADRIWSKEFIEYSIVGELNINTRYDDDKNWIGMTFKHSDGSKIEFRCVDCRNTPRIKVS
ncbi:DUF6134 family protein [Kordiimonas laminariae]|uniref:DUF6134 family protein n=1 Tax=Kordiimonas laminariae TaxID=2917717 RepID=UPI001FF3C913|nr:DUF6134 family protein [Kordiimonas laminariae]